ncbi:MAG: hypothetical protein ACE5DM_00340 [Candidatus Nanoarchaeia archaeon]
MKRAQIWISAILFILVVTVSLAIVLNAGAPIVKNLQDKTIFTRQKNLFLSLDQNIRDIAAEGQGSQRVIPVEIEKGILEVNDGTLRWAFRTDAKILESGREIDLGNVHISSNSNVFTRETNDTYLLGNTYVKYRFVKCESTTSCYLNSSDLLRSINFTNPETNVESETSGVFGFELNGGDWYTPGYSVLQDAGSDLGEASVIYYVNTTSSNPTMIEFTLGSNRDFIEVKIR